MNPKPPTTPKMGPLTAFPWRVNKGRGCYEIRNNFGRLIAETLDASQESMVDARYIVHAVNSLHGRLAYAGGKP